MRSRALLAALCAAAALPAPAGILYKSVDANGTVMFSDTPPGEGARILEQHPIPSVASPAEPASPSAAAGSGLERAYELIDSDAALARANARLDLAEHALALARNGVSGRTEGLRIADTRASLADEQRVEFYKRDLRIARRELIDLLRSRQLAAR